MSTTTRARSDGFQRLSWGRHRQAAAFRAINTDWRVFDHVSSEKTDPILKKKTLRPDILILEPGVPPICLEAEFEPANSVEPERPILL